jgi:DNA polymerase V
VAEGTARRLAKYAIYDMGGVANAPQELLYKEFGINAELLIDHAWGREPCLIEDIKNYKGKSKSVSFSQVLPRDYTFEEARIVFSEMVLNGCQEMMRRHVITKKVGLFVGYTFGGQEPTGGTIRMTITTNLNSCIQPYAMDLFDRTTDKHTPIRRLGITFADVCDEGCEGYDLFTDFDAVKRERERERAVLGIMDKYGKNAVLRGTNHLNCGTQKERNTFIGGHRAGYDD